MSTAIEWVVTLALLAGIIWGLTKIPHSNYWDKVNHLTSTEGACYKIVIIDGCHYLEAGNSLTHRGNCPNH